MPTFEESAPAGVEVALHEAEVKTDSSKWRADERQQHLSPSCEQRSLRNCAEQSYNMRTTFRSNN
jgi:hypothetical protein